MKLAATSFRPHGLRKAPQSHVIRDAVAHTAIGRRSLAKVASTESQEQTDHPTSCCGSSSIDGTPIFDQGCHQTPMVEEMNNDQATRPRQRRQGTHEEKAWRPTAPEPTEQDQHGQPRAKPSRSKRSGRKQIIAKALELWTLPSIKVLAPLDPPRTIGARPVQHPPADRPFLWASGSFGSVA